MAVVTPEIVWDGVSQSYIPGPELRISPRLELHHAAATEIDPGVR